MSLASLSLPKYTIDTSLKIHKNNPMIFILLIFLVSPPSDLCPACSVPSQSCLLVSRRQADPEHKQSTYREKLVLKGATQTIHTNLKRTTKLLSSSSVQEKKDHRASTTANFSRTVQHFSHTMLTGVFNSRLIPSDIRRYLGSTVSVTFFVPKDIFLAGFSSTANREGLWSFRPNKLVNSMLVMLPRVSLDPV